MSFERSVVKIGTHMPKLDLIKIEPVDRCRLFTAIIKPCARNTYVGWGSNYKHHDGTMRCRMSWGNSGKRSSIRCYGKGEIKFVSQMRRQNDDEISSRGPTTAKILFLISHTNLTTNFWTRIHAVGRNHSPIATHVSTREERGFLPIAQFANICYS